jgi:membrane fusion protein, multidrug efflux system
MNSLPSILRAALRPGARTAALLGVLAASGCGGPPPPPPPDPEVTTATIAPQEVALATELPGRTSAYLVAEIRPQVGGLIKERRFVEGSMVKAGDVLYVVDRAPFQAAFDNAKASLARSEATLPALRARAERYKELLPDNAVSRQECDDAAAALTQAEADREYWKAALESARINLAYTEVTAPIAGRIGRSNVTDGALVTAHQPLALATIQKTDPMYVDVPQSTVQLLRLKERLANGRLARDGAASETVDLILEDGSRYAQPGTLQFQDITVDPTTGSVILRLVFPNPDGVLLPGMFVRAVVKEGVQKNAILIPQQAVARDPKGNPTTLVVGADGKAAVRPLVLDRAVGSAWLVVSGLAAGDRVIVEGVQKVRPGAAVKETPAAAPRTN